MTDLPPDVQERLVRQDRSADYLLDFAERAFDVLPTHGMATVAHWRRALAAHRHEGAALRQEIPGTPEYARAEREAAAMLRGVL